MISHSLLVQNPLTGGFWTRRLWPGFTSAMHNQLYASFRQPHPEHFPSHSSHSTHGSPVLIPLTLAHLVHHHHSHHPSLQLSSTPNSKCTFSTNSSHHRSSPTHRTAHWTPAGLPSPLVFTYSALFNVFFLITISLLFSRMCDWTDYFVSVCTR